MTSGRFPIPARHPCRHAEAYQNDRVHAPSNPSGVVRPNSRASSNARCRSSALSLDMSRSVDCTRRHNAQSARHVLADLGDCLFREVKVFGQLFELEILCRRHDARAWTDRLIAWHPVCVSLPPQHCPVRLRLRTDAADAQQRRRSGGHHFRVHASCPCRGLPQPAIACRRPARQNGCKFGVC